MENCINLLNKKMLFIIPSSIDNNTITQVKYEVFYEQSKTSSYLNEVYHIPTENYYLSDWKKEDVFSTNLSLDNIEKQSNSTWEERTLSEFDLFANISFDKTIKVKSKIKAVTKYKPNVIID